MDFDNNEDALKFINRLLERLHLLEKEKNEKLNDERKIEIVIVQSGGQHVETIQTQIIETHPHSKGRDVDTFKGEGDTRSSYATSDTPTERIRHCIALLMEEKYGDALLFNQQNHWQAVYRILVDKGYCRDSDFDGFDTFIRTVMPEEVNKPYKKGSLKQISQTDFVRPFTEWRYDVETTKTRKPFDRMVVVARKFKEILEENGL